MQMLCYRVLKMNIPAEHGRTSCTVDVAFEKGKKIRDQ